MPSDMRGEWMTGRVAEEIEELRSRHVRKSRSARCMALAVLFGMALMILAPAAATYAIRVSSAAIGEGSRPRTQGSGAAQGSTGTASGDCGSDFGPCYRSNWLYRYTYFLGLHPFTSPHDVRDQLTSNFWLFPVSGGCAGRVRESDECSLLGGNPVRVEIVEDDFFQIVTLPGHSLGSGLHIRFAFSRSLGWHFMTVSAWQNKPTECTDGLICNVASRVLAWGLWRVLAETLKLSAYVA
ncbi:hypothetical protein [Streptomyces sp. NPDC048473]|uniref:hypothetical protein n=1 Tax=unclassified Streptomyces TaxID=2593676 RepID=UPI0037240D07